MPLHFRADVALQYARALSRPRFVGTAAEAEVAGELAHHLTRFGYRVERQPFEFSTAVNVVVTGTITLSLICVALALWWQTDFPWTARLLATFVLGAPLLLSHLQRSAERGALDPTSAWARVGRRFRAANLIARLPDDSTPDRPHLVLIAHYDSKSQRMPIGLRVLLVIVSLVSSGLFGLSLWLALPDVALVAGLVTLLCGAPLAWMDWANDSPGAVDNASGVGLVLHLAECLAQATELRGRLRCTITFTSAEELGLMGAAAFAQRYGAALRREGAHVLNFDGVGVEGGLYLAGAAGPLAAQLQHAAREAGLALRRFRLPGVLLDHMPLARAGVDAVSVLAIGAGTGRVHTRHDDAEALHPLGFERAGIVALAAIERLAQSARTSTP